MSKRHLPSPRSVGDERGVSLVLTAAALLALFGFAAIAVDISNAYTERRADQNAADAAALAGAVSMIQGKGEAAIVTDVQASALTNLPGGNHDWANCTDPDKPAGFRPTSSTDCISFGPNSDGIALASIRVRVPDQSTDVSFGRVLGASVIDTTAAATAEIQGTSPNQPFPSFVFSGTGAGGEICIRSGAASGTPSPSDNCEGSSTGNFGIFLPYFYTNTVGLECVSGNQAIPNGYAIAEGLDHIIAANPGLSQPAAVNGADCPSSPGPLNPNQIDFSTGNDPNITAGLVKGGNAPTSYTGRLTRTTWGSPYGTASIFNYAIDNRPLWSYINTSVVSSGSACEDAAGGPDSTGNPADAAFAQARQDMIDCLTNSPPDNLFTTDIYNTRRLTTVPKLHQSNHCGNASCRYDVQSFVPVFIDSLWAPGGPQWTCSGGIVSDPGFCRHDPGRTGSINVQAPGQQRLSSASAVVLDCRLLPDLPGSPAGQDKCKNIAPGGATVFLNIELTG